MVSEEYANAYSEVLGILKYISKEEYSKIPKEKINLFETNTNKSYKFNYNPKKTLDEQGVSKRAKAIIAILFRDYWATEAQREKILKKQNYDRQRLEELKETKYDADIFKNKQILPTQKQEETKNTNDSLNNQNSIPTQNMDMTLYKENIFKRFINKIIKLFRKKV